MLQSLDTEEQDILTMKYCMSCCLHGASSLCLSIALTQLYLELEVDEQAFCCQ